MIALRPRSASNNDTALLDFLETMAHSIEWDDVTREWCVRLLDGPPGRGRTMRAAIVAAMDALARMDAEAFIATRRSRTLSLRSARSN
jgi:hypothetical protein